MFGPQGLMLGSGTGIALGECRCSLGFLLSSVASAVQSILDDPAADVAGKPAEDFWILVAALRQFVEAEGEGNLPLEVSLHLYH